MKEEKLENQNKRGFDLSDLRQNKFINEFLEDLKKTGYSIIKTTEKEKSLFEESLQTGKKFFEQEKLEKEKKEILYDSEKEMGYCYDLSLFKEFFAVKLIGNTKFVQNDTPEYFKLVSKVLFETLESLSKECLYFISKGKIK